MQKQEGEMPGHPEVSGGIGMTTRKEKYPCVPNILSVERKS
jgi:hypothetical protein